jgi:prepilin signal peptidase PulO-like enzyme (type II secretory pathway)
MLVLAAAGSHLGVFVGVLVFGLLVGVLGHIVQSRWLILTGILVIGLVSAYFSFVLQPSGR